MLFRSVGQVPEAGAARLDHLLGALEGEDGTFLEALDVFYRRRQRAVRGRETMCEWRSKGSGEAKGLHMESS